MADKPIAIIMGSQSDWSTMKHAAETLDALGIGYEAKIISAHRTPERHLAFAKSAKANGFKIIIAGAGGAAHLPGVTAALTTLPVFGVPVESKALSGVDSLVLDRADAGRCPSGDPRNRQGRCGECRGTCGERFGAERRELAKRLEAWRQKLADAVAEMPVDDQP